MENNITVLIPIGPGKNYAEWIKEAVGSIYEQTMLPNEILIIDDGTNISLEYVRDMVSSYAHAIEMFMDRFTICPKDSNKMVEIRIWKSPWNLGFASAYNCGMGIARNDLVLYLSSDDKLMPTCIEDCYKTYLENEERDAWYACSYEINGETHTIPNNLAMITKNLWRWLGGYPPSAFAGPDALLLSCLMVHAPDRIVKVAEGKANYWLREHSEQETRKQVGYFAASGVIEVIRDMETRRFKPNPTVKLK